MLTTVERLCEQCHVPFQAEAKRVRAGRGRFCSRSCARRHHAAHADRPPQEGSANPNWRGGVSRQPYRYALRFRLKFPDKYRAQRAFHAAIRRGEIVRPDACSACGRACVPHGHHDDYALPLVVRWLCGPCHRAYHHALRLRKVG